MQDINILVEQTPLPVVTLRSTLEHLLIAMSTAILFGDTGQLSVSDPMVLVGSVARSNVVISSILGTLRGRLGEERFHSIMLIYARVIETSVLQLSLREATVEIIQSAETSLTEEHRTTSLLANAVQVLAQRGDLARVEAVMQFAVAILEENSLQFAINCLDNPRFTPEIRAFAQLIRSGLAGE